MGILTDDMRRVVSEQRLGFIATVNADGTPNLSPKGTMAVWDEDHLCFADIRSPGTVANLASFPSVEVNVVDVLYRKGYRFKGRGELHRSGSTFEEGVRRYRAAGSRSPIHVIVLICVEYAAPLVSPAYDDGSTETEVRARWAARWGSLWASVEPEKVNSGGDHARDGTSRS